jgi:hypothetical protein
MVPEFSLPTELTLNDRTMSRPPRFHKLPDYYKGAIVDDNSIISALAFGGIEKYGGVNAIYHSHKRMTEGDNYKGGKVFRVSSLGKDNNEAEGFFLSVTKKGTWTPEP